MQQPSRWTSKTSLATKIQIKSIPNKNDLCLKLYYFSTCPYLLKVSSFAFLE